MNQITVKITKCFDCIYFTHGWERSNQDKCEHPDRKGKRWTPKLKIPDNCPILLEQKNQTIGKQP